MAPEPRLTRTRSAAALEAAQMKPMTAPADKPKGHTRRVSGTSGIARARGSLLPKPSKGNLVQATEDQSLTAATSATVLNNASNNPTNNRSQIPRSAIPRPVTMSSITSLLRDNDREKPPTVKPEAQPTVAENGRALRSARSFTSLQRKKENETKKGGVENEGEIRTVEDKAQPAEDKGTRADKGKRVFGGRLTKHGSAAPARPISPPRPSSLRAMKRRPQSLSDVKGLFSSPAKSTLGGTRVPPRMKLVQEADVSFDLDSPSPLQGSLAASKNGKKPSSSSVSSLTGTPNTSLSSAVGAVVAAAVAANAAQDAASPRDRAGSLTRSHRRASLGFPAIERTTEAIERATDASAPVQSHNGSRSTSRSGSPPASQRSEPLVQSSTKKPRPVVPETPAIRQLIAREREISRLGDLSGISEGDISLASNASFGTLTPPVSRLNTTTVLPSPMTRFGFERKHAPSTNELQDEIARLQRDREDMEARLSALTAEETRLKSLSERAMRDREDALAAQEEAEGRREGAMWEALLQGLDEALEEENALRNTIASLRAVVQAM